MKMAFIFDIDRTLSDCTERAKRYLADTPKDLDAFYQHCDEDDEIFDTGWVLKALHQFGFEILFVTGRPESLRKPTLRWLESRYGKEIANTKHLFMRSVEDGHRADYVTKMRNYNTFIKDKWHIVGVFEDRDQCVRAWRDIGLTCYQVNYGNF